jgi:hypothetical protein
MKRVMVRYRVHEGRVAENEALIKAVFAELARVRPMHLRYHVYRDGPSFVHVATVERVDGPHPLTSLPAFQEFVARIGERCEEPPVTSEIVEVGGYAG